jgi:hypothetical protein
MQREQISELAHGVNNMLTLYLEVHNGIFAQSWWRSIPIPGLFKAIPFDRYHIQISKVESILREIERHARTLHGKAASNEKAVVAALHKYTVALLKTVIALRPVIVGLKGKIDRKPYDLAKYNADVDAYRVAEKGYHALGEEMNRKWRTYVLNEAMHTETCEVHIQDVMRGLRTEEWVIGEDIKRETYEKFKDGNGRLYAVIAYENGQPQMSVVAKVMWDQVAEQFGDMEEEAARFLEKAKRDLGLK